MISWIRGSVRGFKVADDFGGDGLEIRQVEVDHNLAVICKAADEVGVAVGKTALADGGGQVRAVYEGHIGEHLGVFSQTWGGVCLLIVTLLPSRTGGVQMWTGMVVSLDKQA